MALAMLIVIGLIFTRPRNKVIVPFLLGCFTIPIQQVVVVGGLHFTVLRILIIAGLIRRAILGGTSWAGKFPGRTQRCGPCGDTLGGIATDPRFSPMDGNAVLYS